MEAEDKLRRGVEQRVAHLIVDPGVTVTEHLQGLTRNQQEEFAEFRRRLIFKGSISRSGVREAVFR